MQRDPDIPEDALHPVVNCCTIPYYLRQPEHKRYNRAMECSQCHIRTCVHCVGEIEVADFSARILYRFAAGDRRLKIDSAKPETLNANRGMANLDVNAGMASTLDIKRGMALIFFIKNTGELTTLGYTQENAEVFCCNCYSLCWSNRFSTILDEVGINGVFMSNTDVVHSYFADIHLKALHNPGVPGAIGGNKVLRQPKMSELVLQSREFNRKKHDAYSQPRGHMLEYLLRLPVKAEGPEQKLQQQQQEEQDQQQQGDQNHQPSEQGQQHLQISPKQEQPMEQSQDTSHPQSDNQLEHHFQIQNQPEPHLHTNATLELQPKVLYQLMKCEQGSTSHQQHPNSLGVSLPPSGHHQQASSHLQSPGQHPHAGHHLSPPQQQPQATADYRLSPTQQPHLNHISPAEQPQADNCYLSPGQQPHANHLSPVVQQPQANNHYHLPSGQRQSHSNDHYAALRTITGIMQALRAKESIETTNQQLQPDDRLSSHHHPQHGHDSQM